MSVPSCITRIRSLIPRTSGSSDEILWVVLVGCWMALGYLGAGVLNCITIIGIPFGIQSFKMAKLALWPFGAQIYSL